MKPYEYPIPDFFDPDSLSSVWQVPYQQRAVQARAWSLQQKIQPASQDNFRVALMLVDVQNTFCIPGFELFVAGRSGHGAVADNQRLVQFIYRHLGIISEISLTLDTHQAMQVFHASYLVNAQGEHPAPMTLISAQDILGGKWRFNQDIAASLNIEPEYGQKLLEHYTRQLQALGKYELTIWPYHAMRGSIGHALVSAIEEAVFFHTIARNSQAQFLVKGESPFTENYSAVGPEVLRGPEEELIGQRNGQFFENFLTADAVILTGQAKSHCVAWTIEDLLTIAREIDPEFIAKVYLLEDTTSPVVVPGVVDYTEAAEAAYQRFAAAGAHRVTTTLPLANWPGVIGRQFAG